MNPCRTESAHSQIVFWPMKGRVEQPLLQHKLQVHHWTFLSLPSKTSCKLECLKEQYFINLRDAEYDEEFTLKSSKFPH